jgi:hypothetical protein
LGGRHGTDFLNPISRRWRNGVFLWGG